MTKIPFKSAVLVVLCMIALLANAEDAHPIYPRPYVDITALTLRKDLIEKTCVAAIQHDIYPSQIQVTGTAAGALDTENFMCVIGGKLDAAPMFNESLKASTSKERKLIAVQFQVTGNIKTGKLDIVRTDLDKAKEVAAQVLAGMFFDISLRNVGAKSAVFDAKIAGGRKCLITMNQESQNGAVRWLASDVQCDRQQRKN